MALEKLQQGLYREQTGRSKDYNLAGLRKPNFIYCIKVNVHTSLAERKAMLIIKKTEQKEEITIITIFIIPVVKKKCSINLSSH